MERVHEGDPEKAGLALNRAQWRNLVRRTRDVCDAGLYSMCVTCVHKEEEGFVINPPSIVHAHLTVRKVYRRVCTILLEKIKRKVNHLN